MTTEICIDDVKFLNSTPAYAFDRVFACFKDSVPERQLYRLVNSEKKRWYFFNDSSDDIMRVKAEFKPGSKVMPLRGGRMTTVLDENGETVTTIEGEVEPCFTIEFMEGDPNGFEVSFQMEAAPVSNVDFVYGKPAVRYDRIYRCFRNNGNGLLFRLVDDRTNTWYFYNDTNDFEMRAVVRFPECDAVTALGTTTLCAGLPQKDNQEGEVRGVTYKVVIPPCETVPFINGKPQSYDMHYDAEPISNDRPIDPEYINATPDRTMVSRDAKVYRCFRDKSNGLFFRIVDEAQGIWFYFNDTEEYVMCATVRFPKGTEFTPSADCTVALDGDEAVVTMFVPPLATMKFIDGLPQAFTPSYTGEPINRVCEEEHPDFLNGVPDRSVIDYHTVHRCIKAPDSDEVYLYRLTDIDHNRWAFYNDTTDLTVTARVSFNKDAKIYRLGLTRAEVDPHNRGVTSYVVEVAPLQTVLFIEGQYESFEQKFSGTLKVTRVENTS